jgi:hypothetical protein
MLNVRHFARRQRLQPSNPTALSSTNSFSLNSTEIVATRLLKRARRIVNVAQLYALTYLYEINQSPRRSTPQVDRHVKIPKDKVAFLELVGLVFDTGIILEDELEDGRRTPLDKIDRYFYESICGPHRNNGRPYIPFKWIYLSVIEVSVMFEWHLWIYD